MITKCNHFNKKKHGRPRHPITDHAIVRFLEHTEILDVQSMRNMLFTKKVRDAVKLTKETGMEMQVCDNGLRFVVKEGSVITIMLMEFQDTRRFTGKKVRILLNDESSLDFHPDNEYNSREPNR